MLATFFAGRPSLALRVQRNAALAAWLARESVRLLVGASLGRDKIAQLRKVIGADPAVERQAPDDDAAVAPWRIADRCGEVPAVAQS